MRGYVAHVGKRHPEAIGMLASLMLLALVIGGPSLSAAEEETSLYPPPPPDAPMVGDVNDSSTVSVADAVAILKYTVGLLELTPKQEYAADTTGDGRVSVADAVQILKFTVDPRGESGVLLRPLWEWAPVDGNSDAGLWDPLGLNAG